jgi:glucosamine-6-phosphate deaminase
MPSESLYETLTFDWLKVLRFKSRAHLDAIAAIGASTAINTAIADHGIARIILASAPSQTGFLKELLSKSIDWSKVEIFHMDEYVGIGADHPASFRHYQQQHVLQHIRPAAFHGIRGESTDPATECARYQQLLAEGPIHVTCAGIGENGHLAFNDPPADFNDPVGVKIVDLDHACRQQQVNDGCFPDLDAVPKTAITLTIPTLLSAENLIVVVPGSRKAKAVFDTLRGPVCGSCPASSLRTHPNASLLIDEESAALL